MNESEREVVRYCLQCVADGDVILHDFEFATIMGVEVEVVHAILAAWPSIDESKDSVRLAVGNAFNNLLGYPHAFQSSWESRFTVAKPEVVRVFAKWRGAP